MRKLSISGIKLFKACRRAYQLRYIENLIPVDTSDAIKTGLEYHELIEALYKDGDLLAVDEDYSKAQAMAVAYWKYIYPLLNVSACEEWIDKDRFVGRCDAIAEDGNIVEHKTTSISIDEYEYNLQWDEQILMYMLLSGKRKAYYTIIRKPLLRQKKNETDKEFYDRMVSWYDEDTYNKIRLIEVSRTDAEVNDFADELIRTASAIDDCYVYYKNTAYCNKWGRRCEYSSVCLNYDPKEQYAGYIREEKR